MYIYCKEYTNRWGKRMIAAEYGYAAWRFWVLVEKNVNINLMGLW